MRHKHKASLLLALVALLLLASAALAQVAGYDLSWWTVDAGGGARSAGGSYRLSGAIGQPDAGPALTGGGYRLDSGFWSEALGGAEEIKVYLPCLLR
jgi:hypothetical protein